MTTKNKTGTTPLDDLAALRRRVAELEESEEKRQQAEETLRNSEARYRTLFEDSKDAIFITTGVGEIIDFNQAMLDLFGYTEPEMMALNIQEVCVNPAAWPNFQQAIDTSGSVRDFEIRLRKKEQLAMDCLLTATMRRDNEGHPLAYQGIVRDITERKIVEKLLADYSHELEQKVEQRTAELAQATQAAEEARTAAEAANHAKSAFLANMSHELRTPLNGILGYTQILRQQQNLTPKQIDGLNIIRQSGEHLLTLINDILDLSKIEAQKMDIHPAEVHLPSFLQGVAEMCRLRAEQNNLLFTYQTDNALPTGVHADAKRLRQILINLLGNAVKFTQEGQVTFRVKALADRPSGDGGPHNLKTIRFEVTDTGIGMTPTQLEKIFLPFEQAGEANHNIEGTGLGLAISQKLTQMMGGELKVKSEEGQGSTFWFEVALPVISSAVEEKKPDRRVVVGYKGHPRTVLVVDDKKYNRSVLRDFLIPLGFEVFEAVNGLEGVERARAIQPDIIFMDLVMPVMTGFEATKQLRALPALKDVIIIATSASVFDMDRQQSQLAGCDDFLPKPIELELLLTILETYLEMEWIYEETEAVPDEAEANADPMPEEVMVPPPPEEMEHLMHLVMRGDMRGLQTQAEHLEQKDGKFSPFARKLAQLARGFEEDQLIALLEPYMEGDG